MQLKEKQDAALIQAYEAARHFTTLTAKEEATSEWVRYLRGARESRTFFTGTIRSSTSFAVHASTLVAVAYIECFDTAAPSIAPTAKQIDVVRGGAEKLQREVENAGWLHPDDAPESFRLNLRRLATNPSRVAPRTAGSVGHPLRRRFMESLAESLYYLTSAFPIGFITVATSVGWENISDREVRSFLSKSKQAEISSRVKQRREDNRIAEAQRNAVTDSIQRLLSRLAAPQVDQRSDGEKLQSMIELAATFTNDTAGRDIIGTLVDRGDEHGIERPLDE